MTSEGSCSLYVGFGETLGNNTEKKLVDLWQQLLNGVRSEKVLEEATEGPRTDWNPYRPARGEHHQQPVLNSEVYEWRSTIPVDSLCVVGTTLSIDRSEGKLLNSTHEEKRYEEVTKENVASRKEFVCYKGNKTPDKEEITSFSKSNNDTNNVITTTVTTTTTKSNSKDNYESFIQTVVDTIFNILWRTVAVPWILKRYRVETSQQEDEKEKIIEKRRGSQLQQRFSPRVNRGKRLSTESGSVSDDILNRRRPTTGPAFQRGRAVARTKLLIPAGEKTQSHAAHSPTAKQLQQIVVSRSKKTTSANHHSQYYQDQDQSQKKQQQQKQKHLGMVTKININLPGDSNFPRQRRVSCSKQIMALSPKKCNPSGRPSVLGSSLSQKPLVHGGRTTALSAGLAPRDGSPQFMRMSSKEKRIGVCSDPIEGNVISTHGSPLNRGRKLAPLATRKKQSSSPVLQRQQ